MSRISGSQLAVRLAGAATAVLALDAASKTIAETQLSGATRLIPGLELELGYNSGVAFGALSGLPPNLVLAFTGIVAMVLALFVMRGALPVGPLTGGLILGGALANLVDRVGDGRVTDFIDPARWPTFNLADVAITAGVVVLVVSLVRAEAGTHTEMGQ